MRDVTTGELSCHFYRRVTNLKQISNIGSQKVVHVEFAEPMYKTLALSIDITKLINIYIFFTPDIISFFFLCNSPIIMVFVLN